MNRNHIIQFLNVIPNSNQPTRTLNHLRDELESTSPLESFQAIAALLHMIGLVTYDGDAIRASGHVARYALNSISHYIADSLRWVDDWETARRD
jgi:hypothetical protein